MKYFVRARMILCHRLFHPLTLHEQYCDTKYLIYCSGYCVVKYFVYGVVQRIFEISHLWHFTNLYRILYRIFRLWRCTKDIVSRNILFAELHKRFCEISHLWHCITILYRIFRPLRCIKNIVSQNISSMALYEIYCVAKYITQRIYFAIQKVLRNISFVALHN